MVRHPGTAVSRQRGDSRKRMIDSAVVLLRERSAAGVTVDAVLARSGAPRGSVYHHFPEGRDQIVLEAVGVAGQHVARLIEQPSGSDASAVVRRFLTFWERILRDTGYSAGCPVVALTVDTSADRPAILEFVNDIFVVWHDKLETVLAASGIDTGRARRLATMVIAAAEGAILLCRAQRSAAPLHDVCEELCALLDAAAADG